MANDPREPSGDRFTNSRRGFLGGLAGFGAAASGRVPATGRRDQDDKPWAPKEHDHSGENGSTKRLGEAAPVESITADEVFAARQSSVVYVSELPEVEGSGTESDPYTSPSGTAGMREGFERLDELGGGVIYFPSGFYGDGTTSWEIDLANYDDLGNTDWALYGDGLESSRIRAGNDDGDGIRVWDSSGTAFFYIEIVGLRFEGETSGFQFVLGGPEFENAFNSCWTRFATGNGNPDGDGGCRLNFLLNSYHFGVHNSAGGIACDMRRVQFSGIEGSFSAGSDRGEALRLVEYSFANHFRYANVEATYDGIHIADSRAINNVFQNAYFANVHGTAVVQDVDEDGPRFPGEAEQGTYFHNPFVGTVQGDLVEVTGGTLYVDGSTKKWSDYTVQTFEGEQFGGSFTDAGHVGYRPRSEPPAHAPGRTALTDGESWDPDDDDTAELVISDGQDWIEVQDLGTSL